MAKFNIDAVGIAEIFSNLDALDYRVANASKDALQRGAQIVLNKAKEFVRAGGPFPTVRTGKLAGALKIGRRKSGKHGASVEIGTFGGDAPHAHLVEFGHGVHHSSKWVPAHPFLEPAFDATQDEAMAAIAEAIREAIHD